MYKPNFKDSIWPRKEQLQQHAYKGHLSAFCAKLLVAFIPIVDNYMMMAAAVDPECTVCDVEYRMAENVREEKMVVESLRTAAHHSCSAPDDWLHEWHLMPKSWG